MRQKHGLHSQEWGSFLNAGSLRVGTTLLGRTLPTGRRSLTDEEEHRDGDFLRRSVEAEHAACGRAIAPCSFYLAQRYEISSAHIASAI